jgi:transposase
MGKRARRKFTPEYKAEVVKMVSDGGKSIGELARDLGVTDSGIRAWVERAKVDAGSGPPGVLTTAERQELAHLRRENHQLRMEREILKKATAFFAKESR